MKQELAADYQLTYFSQVAMGLLPVTKHLAISISPISGRLSMGGRQLRARRALT